MAVLAFMILDVDSSNVPGIILLAMWMFFSYLVAVLFKKVDL